MISQSRRGRECERSEANPKMRVSGADRKTSVGELQNDPRNAALAVGVAVENAFVSVFLPNPP